MKMKSTSKLLFFHCAVLFFAQLTMAAQQNLIYHLCVVENGNFTTKSTYESNRDQVLTSLYSNTTINYGFYTSTHGESPDKIYAIAQCRPDMDATSCRACIKSASEELTRNCTHTKEAIGGYEDGNSYCMLRYANRTIFNMMEDAPYFFVYNRVNVTEDVAGFNQTRKGLLDRLISPAAAGNSRNKSASGEEHSSNLTLYAYVQCTPDLTEGECNNCLKNATSRLPQCCDVNPEGRIIYPSCNFRYGTSPILMEKSALPPQAPVTNTTLDPKAPSEAPNAGEGVSRNANIIVSISVAALVILIISSAFT